MSARELTVSCVAQAPVETVWSVLTDLDAAPRTLRGVSKVERVAGEGYEVGTRWRETRKILGREESQTMEVTGVEAPRRTVVESHSAGVHYRTVFTLDPSDQGTKIEMCFGATHPDPTLLHRLTTAAFGRVGIVLTRKLLQQDLADIARTAEERTASSA